MAIVVNSGADIRQLTVDDLIADATERKDAEAIEFLRQALTVKQTNKKTGKESFRQLTSIRNEYVKKFCGYKSLSERSKEEQKKIAEQKKIESINKKLDEALKSFQSK